MARKILLLVTDLQIGGTPTVVRELAVRLNAPPDVRVDVACLAPRGPIVDQLESAGVHVFPLNASGAADLRVFWRLRQLIRSNGYDAVFSFLVHANVAAAVATLGMRHVKRFQSIQTTQPNPPWHWRAQSIVRHAAARIVVPSSSVAHVATEWAHIPPENIVVIPNAIDPERFARDTGFQPVRTTPPVGGIEHGLETRVTGDAVPLGFIGRLDPIKRVPDLLQVVRRLRGRVHLHVFGEGAERPRLEAMIRELGIADSVTMHGAIADPRDALRQIALLVLPSAAEGFGLVLIEAMAAGVPVVATDVPGIRDVVRSGETGLLVPAAAPDQLADAIERVLNDPALRDRLVASAKLDVEQRFAWRAVLPQYRLLLGLAVSA